MDKANNFELNCELNWLNVIFNKEFQNSLDIKDFKEISLVSRVVREKLTPSLFSNLQLSQDSDILEGNKLE
jgi:hypothetical protein